jgi:hypothetical protein
MGEVGQADFTKMTVHQLNDTLRSSGMKGKTLEDALSLDRWGKVRFMTDRAEKALSGQSEGQRWRFQVTNCLTLSELATLIGELQVSIGLRSHFERNFVAWLYPAAPVADPGGGGGGDEEEEKEEEEEEGDSGVSIIEAGEGEDDYRVEEIIDKTNENGRLLYLVKWVGYSAQFNSWETIQNVSDSPQDLAAVALFEDKGLVQTDMKKRKRGLGEGDHQAMDETLKIRKHTPLVTDQSTFSIGAGQAVAHAIAEQDTAPPTPSVAVAPASVPVLAVDPVTSPRLTDTMDIVHDTTEQGKANNAKVVANFSLSYGILPP